MKYKTLFLVVIVAAALLIGFISISGAEPKKSTTSIEWLGHASFEITTSGGKTILIDPWITGNPASPVNLTDITKADIVLITHDHLDHMGDSVEISKRTGAIVITSPEIGNLLVSENDLPADRLVYGIGMNIGGSAEIEDITITMTQAFHSTATGNPTGYIIQTEDGTTIYHAGDTGIFQSMELLGEIYDIDVALLPIGDVFTMGPEQAAYSLKLLKPEVVIPMHYATFPILVQEPDEFVIEAHKHAPQVKVITLDPGETYEHKK